MTLEELKAVSKGDQITRKVSGWPDPDWTETGTVLEEYDSGGSQAVALVQVFRGSTFDQRMLADCASLTDGAQMLLGSLGLCRFEYSGGEWWVKVVAGGFQAQLDDASEWSVVP